MPYSQRISQLEKLHTELDRQINAMEASGPGVDVDRVGMLRTQKQQYLVELARLRKLEWVDRETIPHGDDR